MMRPRVCTSWSRIGMGLHAARREAGAPAGGDAQPLRRHNGGGYWLRCREQSCLVKPYESGEVPGPRIFTAGLPLSPAHALLYYLAGLVSCERHKLREESSEHLWRYCHVCSKSPTKPSSNTSFTQQMPTTTVPNLFRPVSGRAGQNCRYSALKRAKQLARLLRIRLRRSSRWRLLKEWRQ